MSLKIFLNVRQYVKYLLRHFINLIGSGRKEAETPPSCPSTPGSAHGKVVLQPGQARAPVFITVCI